jgi:peptide/nickel transport system ATP-binding protein
MPKGCRFYDRCPHAMKRCLEEKPLLKPIEDKQSHSIRCFLYEKEEQDYENKKLAEKEVSS